MANTFTLNLTYDRDVILDTARKMIEKGGTIYQTRSILDQFYPAWRMDVRTSCTVELMFRDKDDEFFELFTTMLAKAEAEEGESEPVAECWSWCEDPLCPYIHP